MPVPTQPCIGKSRRLTLVTLSTGAQQLAEAVHDRRERGLRDFGLTRQKARYCHGLAARVLDGSLDLTSVARSTDNVGRRMLLDVPGLGPWRVDIYYLMALRRPDVWPQGDLALASAMRELKGLKALPTRDEQQALASRWAPWRSVAARILWAHYLAARGQYQPVPACTPSRGQRRRVTHVRHGLPLTPDA